MSRAKDLLSILESEIEDDIEIESDNDEEDMDDELDTEDDEDEDEEEDSEDEEDSFTHILDVSDKSEEWIKELVSKVMDKCPSVTIDHYEDELTIDCYNQEEDVVEEIIKGMTVEPKKEESPAPEKKETPKEETIEKQPIEMKTEAPKLFDGEPQQPIAPISGTSESAVNVMKKFMTNSDVELHEHALTASSSSALMNYFSK